MAASGRSRENGSAPSGPAIAASAVIASSTVSANTDTQSSVRQAGTRPAVETSPRLGFKPTMLLSMAGTRPEPAVSVPSASGTSPVDTATPEPLELGAIVAQALETVRSVVIQITYVIQFLAAFSVFAGIVILASAIAGTTLDLEVAALAVEARIVDVDLQTIRFRHPLMFEAEVRL